MITVEQLAAFEAVFESGVSGQVGTVEVKVIDNDGVTLIGPTTAGITEDGISGIYIWNAPAAPASIGQDSIVWSLDGSFTPGGGLGIEDLVVVAAGAVPAAPPAVPAQIGEAAGGPCTGWVSTEDVAACCSVSLGSDFDLFAMAATSASQLLYELSAKLFPGLCDRTVRPCEPRYCGMQVLSRGHIVDCNGWSGECWEPRLCDCQPVSRVILPNQPVREIVEVKIDGVVLSPAEYRLDMGQYLTRMRDVDGNRQLWPNCQALDLEDTETGTFSIRYTFGQNPPQPGVDAAAQLACEIYKSCPGNEGVAACALPKNATRVTRQGITIELGALRFNRRDGWKTGMGLVDAFLNTYNPHGKRQRPLIWSADHRYPEPVEATGT